jgi:hypothetical protein
MVALLAVVFENDAGRRASIAATIASKPDKMSPPLGMTGEITDPPAKVGRGLDLELLGTFSSPTLAVRAC